jgi:GNAT superfamily N-acetyltransferase
MSDSVAVIPPSRLSEAIDLLVTPLTGDTRAGQTASIRRALAADPAQVAGFLGSFRGAALTAVCWLQTQPGRTAMLWLPVGMDRVDSNVAAALVARSLDVARALDIRVVQSLPLTDAGDDAQTLREAGFVHIADLLYLVSLSAQFPTSRPASELEFIPQAENSLGDISHLVERTYHDTRDCPALNGVRAIDEVITGYRSIGRFRPDLWLIARTADGDAGCVILADHAPLGVWEIVYLGVLLESRGRGLGLDITRYAQWLAARENVERLVLAVDASNDPALAMYAAAGFVSWDRRSVFVRIMEPMT